MSSLWRTCHRVQFVEDLSQCPVCGGLVSVQFVEDLSVSSLWGNCQCLVCGGLVSVRFVEDLAQCPVCG